MRPITLILTLATTLLAGCVDTTVETSDGGIQTTATRGPVEIVVKADKRTLEVGRTVTLLVEAIVEDDVIMRTPMINANATIGSFNVLQNDTLSDLPLPGRESGRIWTQRLVLDSFKAGEAEIPSFTIAFEDLRADLPVRGSIETEPLPIQIIGLISAEEAGGELREIRGPVNMIDSWPTWIWGLIALGGVVAIFLSILLIRGRGLEAIEQLSPEEQARRDLEGLEKSGLLEQQALQPFYFRLTDILRHYIEGRFGLRAPRSTTAEFLSEMGHSQALTMDQQQTLGQFLRSADMVKFARHEPPVETGRAALEQARFFVDETTPVDGLEEDGS